MTRRLLLVISLLGVGLNIAANSAAQTVSNGPYYATPSWDQKFQCDPQATCPRFVVLPNWNNEAVLDRETGLVWQCTIGGEAAGLVSQDLAFESCNEAADGGRQGWRLPSLQELNSLLDPTVAFPAIALPAGHPFLSTPVILFSGFWTVTTAAQNTNFVYVTSLMARSGGTTADRSASLAFWCVRGGGVISIQ